MVQRNTKIDRIVNKIPYVVSGASCTAVMVTHNGPDGLHIWEACWLPQTA